MKRIIAVLALALIPGLCLATPAQLSSEVFSPEQGIICDKLLGFCADAKGVSMALTRKFLGAEVEKKTMALVEQLGGPEKQDYTVFYLSNGVYCDCKIKKCTVPDAASTKALFGQ